MGWEYTILLGGSKAAAGIIFVVFMTSEEVLTMNPTCLLN